MATKVQETDAAEGKSATWPCPQQKKLADAYDKQQGGKK